MQIADWQAPPAALTLPADELHIWLVSLVKPAHEFAQLSQLLAADERARAERYYFGRDRIKYTIARASLRVMLARYLNVSPTSVEFIYQKNAKPALANFDTQLKFNLSHSGELAAYAFARDCELGIDIELLREVKEAQAIAARNFSACENEVFKRLPLNLRTQSFFNCWTRKEAFIKAIGDGLSYPLDKFDVTFAPGEDACFLNIANDPIETARWSLYSFIPAENYIAALAAPARQWQLKYFQL